MRRILFTLPILCLLSLPLHAQDEALHGSWEGSFLDDEGNNVTGRLTFTADGAFEMDQEVHLGEASRSSFETMGTSVEKLTIRAVGTYQVDGDGLLIDLTEMEILLDDGRDFWEVLTEFARGMARAAADLTGVSEDDYPAFEEAAVNEFLAGVSEEQFVDDLSGEGLTWSVEGDTLTITSPTEDGGQETSEFQRVTDDTAVAGTTWGALKASSLR